MSKQDVRREAQQLARLNEPKLCADCRKSGAIFYTGGDGAERCPECHEAFLFAERVREHGGLTG